MFNDDNIYNYLCLTLLVLSWLVVLFLYQKRKRKVDAGTFLLCSYLFYSVVSFLLFLDPNRGLEYSCYKLSLFPFIYLVLFEYIATKPVLLLNLSVNKIKQPNRIAFFVLSWIFIACSILRLPSDISNLFSGIKNIVVDSSAGLDTYREAVAGASSIGDGSISNLPSIVSNCLSDIGILFFFYYLSLNKKNVVFIVLLGFACLSPILGSLASAQRGPIFQRVATMLVTYFALKPQISPRINKRVKYIGFAFLIVLLIPISAITHSRFDRGDGGSSSALLDYIGQENLNFNIYAFDNNGIRYGDRTFSFFKRCMGVENTPANFMQRRAKYPNLRINDEVFITFVGDFVLDFGPVFAAMLIVLFNLILIFQCRPRKHILRFEQLILLHFAMCVCAQGGLELFTFSDMANLRIVVVFLAIVYFYFSSADVNVKSLSVKHYVLTKKYLQNTFR